MGECGWRWYFEGGRQVDSGRMRVKEEHCVSVNC